MTLREISALVRANLIGVIAVGLLGAIAAAGYLLFTTPQYSAKTELFVALDVGSSTQDLSQGGNFAQQQARNFSAVATREIVLKPVITALELSTTPAALASQVTATVPLNTSLISITVTDASPAQAAAIANAVATSLANTAPKLLPTRRDGTSPVKLETVQPAAIPVTPSTPSSPLLLGAGALVGLLLGAGFVVARERISAKVRTTAQVRAIDNLTVLGSITHDRRAAQGPVLTPGMSDSLRAEEFRQLRTNLRFLQTSAEHKAYVITSATAGEGKSSAAASLAVTLASAGSSVCLVEADLRKPMLDRYLDLEGSIGLTTVITGEATLDDAMQSWGSDGLQVLLAGEIPPNPSELLGSDRAEELFTSISKRFDFTIVDAPPLLPVTDATVLAKTFGGAILVASAGRVRISDLRRAVEALQTAGSRTLGVILNSVPPGTTSLYRQERPRESQSTRRRSRSARTVEPAPTVREKDAARTP